MPLPAYELSRPEAGKYLGEVARVKGFTPEPEPWIETLVRMYPVEVYIRFLAKINRSARSAGHTSAYEERFPQRLRPATGYTHGSRDSAGWPRRRPATKCRSDPCEQVPAPNPEAAPVARCVVGATGA